MQSGSLAPHGYQGEPGRPPVATARLIITEYGGKTMVNGAHRTIAAIVAALGLGIGGAAWAATAASAAPSAPSGIPPVCGTGNLAVWVNVNGGSGAAGTWYYPLEFTNVSGHTCRVWGYPGVSATNAAGGQLGDAARRISVFPAKWVNIVAGGTAHALFGYGAAEVDTSNCKSATASFLKVYPPNRTSARTAFFDFPACTLARHTYLLIGVIQPGTSI